MRTPITLTLLGHELGAKRRTLSLFLAVVLGGTLAVAAIVLGGTLQQRIDTGAQVNYEGSDLVVRSSSSDSSSGASADTAGSAGAVSDAVPAGISPEDVDAINDIDGVADADGITKARAGLWVDGSVTPTAVESLPSEDFRWQEPAQGRFPTEATEVALGTETMKSAGVSLGDVVTLATDEAGDGQFTVVGTVDTRGALDYESADYAVVTPELAQAFAGTDGSNEVRVALTPEADENAVIDEINARVPGGWPETTSALVKGTEATYSIGLGALSTMINGFALVAAVVALTVLATVVWASLPGRRRQLALMRLVGATKSQITTVLVLETAVIAAVGAVLAIPIGIGLSYLALPAVAMVPGVPTIPWSQVVIPVAPLVAVPVVAVVGAVLAVAVPAFLAGGVPPAAALRRSSVAEPSRPTATVVALVAVAVLALLLVVVATVGGTRTTAVVAVLFVLALILAVPALCRVGAGLAARIAGERHPLGEIGAAEVRSFPGRTAATGLAAMLAATVMALSWVTLSSVGAISGDHSSDSSGPELQVGAYAGQAALDPVVVQALSDVDGVDTSVPVETGDARLSGDGTRLNTGIVAGDAADFAEATDGQFPLSQSDEDTVYLPASEQTPFRDGSSVTLTGPDGEKPLTVRYVQDLPISGLIAPQMMSEVGIDTSTPAVWLSLDDDANRADVLESVQTLAIIGGDLPVTGTAVNDAKVDQLITSAQRIATPMLGVAVLIAIIGSVVTMTAALRGRTGEFAVLRLLGMESRQLRRLVGAETVTVGVVSVVIGLAAGTLLGWAASSALADTLGVARHASLPLIALLVMGAVTVVSLRVAVTGAIDRTSYVPPAVALRDANLGGNQ
ncbi:MAG TPA: FtsX-like permease family protein [Candidatus Corynebacterium avicola]|uniref:FtsX-like permease family protein n=1 Tax=Candidatus Corynebacterium avicola TaxID=2838527 RepID=A0A9D1RPM7_9CORY|nr:FtsX-like permease family protein [Candidatus Corynebacterium avicola]